MSDTSKCACRSTDARRCYEIRNPPPMCDLERSYYFEEMQQDDCACECGCHEPDYDDQDDNVHLGPNGECPICGAVSCACHQPEEIP
jgi:hypothetical protein